MQQNKVNNSLRKVMMNKDTTSYSSHHSDYRGYDVLWVDDTSITSWPYADMVESVPQSSVMPGYVQQYQDFSTPFMYDQQQPYMYDFGQQYTFDHGDPIWNVVSGPRAERSLPEPIDSSVEKSSLISFVSRRPSVESPDDLRVRSLDNNIRLVTLNREKHFNALTLGMIQRLTSLLKTWGKDGNTKAVVMTAKGEKAFSSGNDLKLLYSSIRSDADYCRKIVYDELILAYIIGSYRKPFVPLCNGFMFGGAACLSVVSKICVCSEKAVFAMPECEIGFFTGCSYFRGRMPSYLSVFLGLTGQQLKGRDIVSCGLASHYILSKYFKMLKEEITHLNKNSPSNAVIDILNKYSNLTMEGSRETNFSLDPLMDQISVCFGGSTVEQIVSRLINDGSLWAKEQLLCIRRMSPTSLKITLKLLQDGTERTFAESLVTEYRLSQRCLEDHDFMEGLQSIFVYKDHKPKWKPERLSQVNPERVSYYFSPSEFELKFDDADSKMWTNFSPPFSRRFSAIRSIYW